MSRPRLEIEKESGYFAAPGGRRGVTTSLAHFRLWHFSDLFARTGDVRSAALAVLPSSICHGQTQIASTTTCCEHAHAEAPPRGPDVADTAPSDHVITVYDEEHLVTYLRLLDADAEGADWRQIARIVLHRDPEQESDRARRAFESHLSRAKWMTERGRRQLLRGGASA